MSTAATLRRSRLSIRTRLTLLYASGVLACGTALLAGVYLLMRFVPTYELAPALPVVGGEPADQPAQPAVELSRVTPITGPTSVIASKDDVLDELLRFSVLALGSLVLISLLAGWLIAGRILAPIHRMTRTARAIVGSTTGERIRLDGPDDEFTRLADTIDTMLDRVQSGVEAQRRFAANASHELRTPLASTRTALQVALAHPTAHDASGLLPKLLAENERSIATVETLLGLARAENGLDATLPADLGVIGRQALDQVLPEAATAHVHLDAELQQVVVDGDEDLLRHALVNLLTNAIRHNHPGGHGVLSVVARAEMAVITVTNTGRPVDPDAVEHLFEPFQRARTRDGSRGHGLGLALVRAIAGAHDGRVHAEPNPGGGLTVVLTLPQERHPLVGQTASSQLRVIRWSLWRGASTAPSSGSSPSTSGGKIVDENGDRAVSAGVVAR